MIVCEVPATAGQRLLWLLDHYWGDQLRISMPICWKFRGNAEAELLDGAIAALIQRHEAFRTTVTGGGARLRQCVHDALPVPLKRIDHTDTDADPELVQRELASELAVPIDAEQAPVRATLWRFRGEEYVCCITVHHLLTDGASTVIAVRDLLGLLQCARGRVVELPQILWQNSQFALWQRDFMRSAEMQEHRRYWHDRLAGVEFPRLPKPAALESVGQQAGSVTATLDGAIFGRLGIIARAERVSLFSLMFGIFCALLRSALGQDDLAVATLLSNRLRYEVQNTVGFMANMGILRVNLAGANGLGEIVSRCHAAVAGALRYQAMPFQMLPPEITGAAGRRADDIVFQMTRVPVRGEDLGGDLEMIQPAGVRSPFGMEIGLVQLSDRLFANLRFNPARVDAAWASRLMSGYAALATRCAGEHSVSLHRVDTEWQTIHSATAG